MFEDIEEFGYDRDLVIEEETNNDEYTNNVLPNQFFPTDDGFKISPFFNVLLVYGVLL